MVDSVGRLRLGRTAQHSYVPIEHVAANSPPKWGRRRRGVNDDETSASQASKASRATEQHDELLEDEC